jgi:cell division protease FtsH
MVRDWGMSPKLGPVGLSTDGPNYLGKEDPRSRSYAEQTQRVIDEEVSRLLIEAERRATELLTTHRDALDRLIALLLEKETIDGNEVYATINPDPASHPEPLEAPIPNGRPPRTLTRTPLS